MDQTYMASLCHQGLLGGGLFLDDVIIPGDGFL